MDEETKHTINNTHNDWSKYAAWSFVLGIALVLLLNTILLSVLGDMSLWVKAFVIIILSLAVIVVGSRGLIEIRKSATMKGMALSVIGIMLGSIILIYGGLLVVGAIALSDSSNDPTESSFFNTKIQLTEETLIWYTGFIELYKKNFNVYPRTISEAISQSILDETLLAQSQDADEQEKDLFGNPYYYEVTDDGYDLRSLGADGEYGTADDVTLLIQ